MRATKQFLMEYCTRIEALIEKAQRELSAARWWDISGKYLARRKIVFFQRELLNQYHALEKEAIRGR